MLRRAGMHFCLLLMAVAPAGCGARSDGSISQERAALPSRQLVKRVTTPPDGGDETEPEIVLVDGRIAVHGLPAAALDALAGAAREPDEWHRVLAVRVAQDAPPMLGTYTVEPEQLVFSPRFPLEPGLAYRVEFSPAAIPEYGDGQPPVMQEIALPAPSRTPVTEVVQVFPTRATLPENQLKFYLHFSQPMSRGQAYQSVRLLRDGETEIEAPFLELGEELWDPSGTRFTLFFDPGRIKRGLKPREEVGPAIEEGNDYTLVIDRKWEDAEGRPLTSSHRKSFRVTGPDDTQPDPAQWTLAAPTSGTNAPLQVVFSEPLDHAMLKRVLIVQDSQAQRVPGKITIDQQEMRWRFRPDAAWASGRYQLVVDAALEDLAGNSIAKPFEVDVFDSVQPRLTTQTIALDFEVP